MTDLFRLDRMVANHRSDFWNGQSMAVLLAPGGKVAQRGDLGRQWAGVIG
jgi:hypothetical protein